MIPIKSRFRDWLLGAALVLAVVFAYQPAWNAGFIWDDDDYVTNNPLITAPDGLKRIWFSTDSPSQYFPLTYTIFRAEHALWGFNAAGYHWVNILLHAANALLVWGLLRRLAIPGAWLAAGIFALHPVQVESVAWITELKNVQSLFFSLLALHAWVAFTDHRRDVGHRGGTGSVRSTATDGTAAVPPISIPAGRWYYALALFTYTLALCSKTTACTIPAALLLVLWWKRQPINFHRLLQVAPFVVLGLAMGLVSMWWERHHQGTEGAVYAMSAMERVLVASRAVWFYAGKLIWPADLTFNYPLWKIDPADARAYGWLVASIAVAGLIWLVRRRAGRGVETAALFYAATLSPLLGFIMLYTFRYTFVADHYQYVALLGPVALFAAFGAGRLRGRGAAVLRPALAGALLLGLATLTWRQSRMYRDLETLWRVTLERNPASYMAHNNLGAILLGRGEIDAAITHFEKALAILPTHGNAEGNLGHALLRQGRVDEAAAHFRRAVELEPASAKAQSDLGFALLETGQLREAVAHAQRAVELAPEAAEAWNVLGLVQLRSEELDAAQMCFAQALAIQPDSADARENLVLALRRKEAPAVARSSN